MAPADGTPIAGDSLVRMRRDGELPLMAALKTETSEGPAAIPLERVRYVEMATVRHAARNGFLVGLGADLIFMYLINSLSESNR